MQTPHLDLLAAEGTRFSACITPSVVCQPARASILTGLLPLTHGVHDNGIEIDERVAQNGFAGALSRGGCATHFIGKGHFPTYFSHQPRRARRTLPDRRSTATTGSARTWASSGSK